MYIYVFSGTIVLVQKEKGRGGQGCLRNCNKQKLRTVNKTNNK